MTLLIITKKGNEVPFSDVSDAMDYCYYAEDKGLRFSFGDTKKAVKAAAKERLNYAVKMFKRNPSADAYRSLELRMVIYQIIDKMMVAPKPPTTE